MNATIPKISDIPRNLTADLAESIGAATLERLQAAQDQGQKALPYLRVAARCAGLLARAAVRDPELRERAAVLLHRTVSYAVDADRAATESGTLTSAYLSVMATCAAWLLRLREATQREEQHAARTASSGQPESLHKPQPVPPSAPRAPLTQRARWLAAQKNKKRKSG